MTIYAFEAIGFTGELVSVEVDIRRGIPCVDIVGLADNAVKEARERIRAAIRNSGFSFPMERLLINLAPAGIKKAGASFDLAMATSVLSSSMQIPQTDFSILLLGELELSGRVRPVSGVLSAIAVAKKAGISHFVVPEENLKEAMVLGGYDAVPISNLKDIVDVFSCLLTKKDFYIKNPYIEDERPVLCEEDEQGLLAEDMADIRGQENLRRAIEISAAGAHHLMLFGPPGTGKTMAARRLPGILPNMDEKEAIEATMIHSLSGKLPALQGLLCRPPFRCPHHSASVEGIVGGGRLKGPGEISLSHGGVLFLDETPEFKPNVLQSLREPLESGIISISRADKTVFYPSSFILITACNPCPCGNLGREGSVCLCSGEEIRRYWKRLGGPLLDRIDIRIPVRREKSNLLSQEQGESSKVIRQRVCKARLIQKERYKSESWSLNGRMPVSGISKYCHIDDELNNYFSYKADELGLSSRACHSILRVSRTIADLEQSPLILKKHIDEAFSLRRYGDEDFFWQTP